MIDKIKNVAKKNWASPKCSWRASNCSWMPNQTLSLPRGAGGFLKLSLCGRHDLPPWSKIEIGWTYLPKTWLGLLRSHVPICTGGLAVPVSKRWPRSKDMYTTHEFEINTHFNFPVFRSHINNLLSEFRQNGVWPATSNIRPSRPASVGLEMHQKAFWESSKWFVIRADGNVSGWRALVAFFCQYR